MLYLKADTATEVLIGPAVAVGDGFTPVTTLSVAGADEAHLIKHGATTGIALAGTLGVLSAVAVDGYYALNLSTGETDTEGRLSIMINDDSLILPIRHEFMVVNANVYDSMFAAAGTLLQVDVTEIVTGAVPTPTTTGVPDVNVERWVDTLVTISPTTAKPETDAFSISDDAGASDNLEESATAIVLGVAEAGTLSETAMTTDLSEPTNDHYIGRTVIWTTGILAGQASDITDYLGSTGMLTYSTITEPPGVGDAFVIV